jgi:hypothetical protein
MEGDTTVPLNGTGAFRLIALYSDFTRRDVTADAEWSSPSGSLVSFDAPGVVRGRVAGAGSIVGRFQGRQTALSILVLPAGTFRVTGKVVEAQSGAVEVRNARVTVVTGTGAGLTTVTGFSGEYALYGVAGAVRLEISREGYHTETRTFDVVSHASLPQVELTLTRARPDVSGTDGVTISASHRCGLGLGTGNLPDEARSRSYSMDVRQQGPRLEGVLRGPGVGGVNFPGLAEPQRLFWEFFNPDDNSPADVLVDRLPSGALLVASGTITVPLSGNPLAGTLFGWLAVLDPARQRTVPALASCDAPDHQFVMTRPGS